MNNPKNNLKKGIVEFTIFEEGDHYVAVCLTFDIVLEGKDYSKIKNDIVNSARLHLKTVKELGLSEELLNRPAPKEYWAKRGKLLINKNDNKPAERTYYERATYNPKGVLANC